jgi:hypothetical protein
MHCKKARNSKSEPSQAHCSKLLSGNISRLKTNTDMYLSKTISGERLYILEITLLAVQRNLTFSSGCSHTHTRLHDDQKVGED